ncbi:hypothetical protein [Pseudoalteromonas gelatinilytica]|uniref:Uncharacterized protein n=1 Tax=Pseudoalteromonas gelatinilytica TaxID=1703256 RepID=A0ABQ1T5F6_9GAMM|nr:hypothetical protein [Pseudoalteromonas profundi]GGE83055.1 hypothetical protein GCM10008027_04760 [Pseudoalteromonas profundi]
MLENGNHKAIAQSVITLAGSLELELIAEVLKQKSNERYRRVWAALLIRDTCLGSLAALTT